MGLLTGGVRALAGQVLGPLYPAGTITRKTETTDGQGGISRTSVTSDCQVQVDSVTEQMRKAEGFSELDSALYILAASYSERLQPGDEIAVLEGPHAGSTWKAAAPISADPGGAYQLCRGVLRKATA